MTEEITEAPEEITEDIVQPDEEQIAEMPSAPAVSPLDLVQPMERRELFERGLMLLQISAEENPLVAEYYKSLREEYFGPDVPEQEAMDAPIDDKRQQTLISEFIDNKVEIINSDVVSLNQDSVNNAFREIFTLVGIDLHDIESLKESFYDSMFEKRCEKIPELIDEYRILQLNRDVYNIYQNKSGTLALNGIIMKMENRYSKDEITREQLAQFYYNIGCIYEVHSLQKNTEKMVKDEHFLALDYKRKALNKTKKNMELILDVHRDWRTHFSYAPQKILDACHRVIDNSNDSRSLYQAHMLYAETLQDFKGTDGFGDKRQKRINSIIKHYRDAVNYTENKEEKIDILDMISTQQKIIDKPGYIRTRMEMASLMSYRSRIREYSNLVDEADSPELKAFMCRAGINEFFELTGVDKEDRKLYDELDSELRRIIEVQGGDAETIAQLDDLKAKYGTVNDKKQEPVFAQMSTSGHDFFASDRGR